MERAKPPQNYLAKPAKMSAVSPVSQHSLKLSPSRISV